MAADPNRFDDLFAPFGRITLRRMFGGEGIYGDQLMFGLVYQDRIFFKVSEETRAAFVAEGCGPLKYKFKNTEGVLATYHELPERLYDDPDELAAWAHRALAAAQAKRTVKKSAPKKPAKKLAKKPAKKAAKKKRR